MENYPYNGEMLFILINHVFKYLDNLSPPTTQDSYRPVVWTWHYSPDITNTWLG